MEITKQQPNINIKGILTLIGGFFLMLMNGSIFLWGTLNVYITSYFRQKNDPDLSLNIGGALFPLMTACLATGIPLGIKFIKLFGQARYSLLLNTIITSLMVILSSYAEKFYQFAIIYGVINGIAAGSIYFVPIYMGYLHFPNNNGIVSGINTCGFALCSFLFSLLFTKLVNPDGLQQNSNSDGYSYFDGDSISVAQNVPEALRKIGYIFLSVSVCATQLIFYHPNQIGEEQKRLKKQLQLKQQEKKHFQDNLITIEQEIHLFDDQNDKQKQIQDKQSMIENNQNSDQSQHDFLRQSQQIFIQKIKISEMEEQVLEEKIHISHKKDEQAGLAYANPSLIEEIKQNSEKVTLKKDKKGIEDDYKKIIQLMQNEIYIPKNKEQHVNLYVQESDQNLQLAQENLVRKEEEIKEELKITHKKLQEIDELDKLGAPNILLALKQPKFYLSIFLVVLCLGFGSLINANYKSIAKDYGFKGDSFQTLVGSLAGIANGISRPVWSGLLDRFKFKYILISIICIQIATSLSFQVTRQSEVYFAIWVFIVHFCFGGVLGILPAFSAQLSGVKIGSQLFGFYWYGFSIANLIQFVLVLELKKQIGFNNIFYIYFGQLVMAFVIMYYFQFKIEWSKCYMKKKKEETLNTNSNENIQSNVIDSEQNQLNLVVISST
ncbi:hypothetical protein ABPG74_006893 [Tetrahymena malaccensis]